MLFQALTQEQVNEVTHELMANWSRDGIAIGAITDAELADAVRAVDDWIVANDASLVAAFPEPSSSQLSEAQKSQMFAAVAYQRYLQQES